jgi:hypothetical protein
VEILFPQSVRDQFVANFEDLLLQQSFHQLHERTKHNLTQIKRVLETWNVFILSQLLKGLEEDSHNPHVYLLRVNLSKITKTFPLTICIFNYFLQEQRVTAKSLDWLN